MKSLFGKAPRMPLPEIHIHHPDHAPVVNPDDPGGLACSGSSRRRSTGCKILAFTVAACILDCREDGRQRASWTSPE